MTIYLTLLFSFAFVIFSNTVLLSRKDKHSIKKYRVKEKSILRKLYPIKDKHNIFTYFDIIPAIISVLVFIISIVLSIINLATKGLVDGFSTTIPCYVYIAIDVVYITYYVVYFSYFTYRDLYKNKKIQNSKKEDVEHKMDLNEK